MLSVSPARVALHAELATLADAFFASRAASEPVEAVEPVEPSAPSIACDGSLGWATLYLRPSRDVPAYALVWDNGIAPPALCEVESFVCYEIGSRDGMSAEARKANADAVENNWSSRYFAVPLPFVGALPNYAFV